MFESLMAAVAEDPRALVPYAGMLLTLILMWSIFSFLLKCTRETERTKREIAAYVAEGSISPEDAERLLKPRPWHASGRQGNDSAVVDPRPTSTAPVRATPAPVA